MPCIRLIGQFSRSAILKEQKFAVVLDELWVSIRHDFLPVEFLQYQKQRNDLLCTPAVLS